MNGFQVVFVSIAGIMLCVSLISIFRGGVTLRGGLLWALLWAAAGIAIARPDITVVIARRLGIGRGADLVLYCSVVGMGVGFLWVYAKLQKLRREMTTLVREIALRDARMPATGSEGR